MSDVRIADEFMRRKLITLDPMTKVLDGVARLLKDNISGAPVVDADGRYLGVFSEKCCMNALTEVVEVAHQVGMHVALVREFMTCKLLTLSPDVNVFDAIDHILANLISGAPVVDENGEFQGIFSEKTAMRVLISAAYDQLPGTNVGSYMNTDRNRVISEEHSLLDVAHKFQETPYRRLPVLNGHSLAGQVSRRDVLRAEHRLSKQVAESAVNENADARLREANTAAEVAEYMDVEAKTITRNLDMLGVAQIFLNSPYRRLPVVEDGRLLGQVSRRDLLTAAAALLQPKTEKRKGEPLYLSPLSETRPPFLEI